LALRERRRKRLAVVEAVEVAHVLSAVRIAKRTHRSPAALWTGKVRFAPEARRWGHLCTGADRSSIGWAWRAEIAMNRQRSAAIAAI
jgi:hypothetical protein